jgi:tRNA(Ile)-lysidine synthase
MNKIESHIASFLGDDPSLRYFVASSGGVDSMVLLAILHKLGKRVSAVHVNYLLRGNDSELDQEFVEKYCAERMIPCHVKRVDLKRYLDEVGGNLQEQARKVRYSYFETFKIKRDNFILLGQHSDDQVETFFLNLARGGGIMGLACMLPKHEQYLRPLLPFTKEEILDYANENGIMWREDASNATEKYNRNKLRNVLIPEMESGFPDLKNSVLTLVQAFQDTQTEMEKHVRPTAQLIEKERCLSFNAYDGLSEFEKIELLRQLTLNGSLISELDKLRSADKGKRIELPTEKYKTIIREHDHFYFGDSVPLFQLPQIYTEHVDRLPSTFSKDAVYLDPSKIKGSLQLRPWRIGDRIKPIGLQGSKLISDILTDAKVPHHVRQHQLVLTDDEKIIWCVGFAVGRDAVAGENSEIVCVSLI